MATCFCTGACRTGRGCAAYPAMHPCWWDHPIGPNRPEPMPQRTIDQLLKDAEQMAEWYRQAHEEPASPDVLGHLRAATVALDAARVAHEDLIRVAIEAGHSEREIGGAAGLSGVAIHNRKTALPFREFGASESVSPSANQPQTSEGTE